jgi:hypothetical protein
MGAGAVWLFDEIREIRQCRDYFCKPNMTHKDRTGWLGREDSNLRMALFTEARPA